MLTVRWLNTNDIFFANSQVIECQKGHNQAERPKPGQKGQKETNGPFLVICLYFLKHTRGCRAPLVTKQLSTLESSSLFRVITNNSAQLKKLWSWISNWYFKFQIFFIYCISLLVLLLYRDFFSRPRMWCFPATLYHAGPSSLVF